MVRRGQSEAVKTHLAIIREAAGKRWQASAWWLERRCPQRWGRTERQTLHERKIYERDEADKIEEDPYAGSDLLAFLKMPGAIKSTMKSGTASAATESEGGLRALGGAPESGTEFKGDCEDLEGGAGKEPAPSPAAEEREITESRDMPPALPLPCGEEPLQSEPCAVKTPTVFIGGARNGEAAEYDGADALTHIQSGYRLRRIYFTWEGRTRNPQVLADPATENLPLAREAIQLLNTGNRATVAALTAQESSLYNTNGN